MTTSQAFIGAASRHSSTLRVVGHQCCGSAFSSRRRASAVGWRRHPVAGRWRRRWRRVAEAGRRPFRVSRLIRRLLRLLLLGSLLLCAGGFVGGVVRGRGVLYHERVPAIGACLGRAIGSLNAVRRCADNLRVRSRLGLCAGSFGSSSRVRRLRLDRGTRRLRRSVRGGRVLRRARRRGRRLHFRSRNIRARGRVVLHPVAENGGRHA